MPNRRRAERPAGPASCRSAAAALLATIALACGGQGGEAPPALELADYVWFQEDNVTTDVISVPGEQGIERFGYGWRPAPPNEESEPFLVLHETTGEVSLFSADGDLASILLEGRLDRDTGSGSVALGVFLNGQRCRNLKLTGAWQVFAFDVPEGLARAGINTLELRILPTEEQLQAAEVGRLWLRRLRFRAAGGRPPLRSRPEQIEVRDEDAGNSLGRTIRMPTGSFVDLVASLPGAAAFEAQLQARRLPGAAPGGATAYVALLDETGEERTLFEHAFDESSPGQRDVAVDLAGSAGRLCRLRIGTRGTGNLLFEWRGARIGGSDAPEGLAAASRRSAPPRSARLGRPDILFVLIDAARADAYSTFGGPHPSPALERLAADGTRFSHALSPAPWTGQSVPAILTGLHVDTLGVGAWESPMPADASLVSELLQQAGYRTLLFSQHPFYKGNRDLKRGFDEVVFGPFQDYGALPEPATLFGAGQPTFSFVHLLPPHAPYDPPPPFGGAYSGWFEGKVDVSPEFLKNFPEVHRPEELDGDERRYVFDRYLENAAYSDWLAGEILDGLQRADRYDDTMIVLLSDHGEAFLEHGYFLHATRLYDEFLHVPLIVKWPTGVGGFAPEVAQRVSLVDLVPTLVDGLALGAGDGFQGESLLPLVFEGATRAGPLWAVTRGVGSRDQAPVPFHSLILDGWKAIFSPLTQETRLYRLDEDPGELQDLAAAHPTRALLMRQAILAQHALNQRLLNLTPGHTPPDEVDRQLLEQLEALGYL